VQPETEDVNSDAAIDLLDQTESENIRLTATAPAPDREAPDGEAREPLAGAIRVGGRVVNLSASGLAIDVASDATQREGMSRIVDPDFEGPFPLAGLTCTPVSTQRTPRGHRIKMTFQELPTPRWRSWPFDAGSGAPR
jgi:hypothetical protein